ncbi:MAG TPA: hypothetical protein VE621_07600 [Bryobacteraceae bacterium]|jgi:hypothetical protein|nr:hypothetical protein [Bryobacteraceae bacterium]
MRPLFVCLTLLASSALVIGAEKYTGPRPPKPDIPYLVHADKLIETEIGEGQQEARKDNEIAYIPGPSSPVKTPIPEPFFLVKTEKLDVRAFQCYRLETKGGRREVILSTKKGKQSRDIPLVFAQIEPGLYKVEVDQLLEVGEYTLSPSNSNKTFSFQVY